ncbi:hypothetical protein FV242_10625 [Methylobacterium sp. WL64]|nr:hypothetical protein FVA80_28560 [Methylobacterium sp. WL1]TXN03611.1 hypothetical protein FV242_10625 [Methylobacterium sp. WL64]TXN54215.1 hypothetical protein FV241_24985 [Methylobacterium sp. WL2]
MPDVTTRGPQKPGRIIFIATALVGTATGFITGDIVLFILALFGCASVLSVSYALVARRLGWQPVKFGELFDMVLLLAHP